MDRETLTLALGIIAGMFYYNRTGYSCGGIISPGIIALHLGSPEQIASSMLAGMAIAFILQKMEPFFGFYGRQRTSAAMLAALILRALLSGYPVMQSLWLGWAVPGLIASDIMRQGSIPTISGALASGVAASFAAFIIDSIGL